MSLRYDGKVAIITGAGGALGSAYARMLASRGAKVVVNDFNAEAAEKVANDIVSRGGEAIADSTPVQEGHKLAKKVLDKYGKVDILVNNAGQIIDRRFEKMTSNDWKAIHDVHVLGAFRLTRAVWPSMRDNKYGRIVFTSSSSGLYGNFGQANYAAAKMALVGLAQTLALEGAKYNIKSNVVAPTSASQMTKGLMPPDMLKALPPDACAPIVGLLTHEKCPANGKIIAMGGGWFGQVRQARSAGVTLDLDNITPEGIKANWSKIIDFEEPTFPTSAQDTFTTVFANLSDTKPAASKPKAKKSGGGGGGKKSSVDVEKALAFRFPPSKYTYSNLEVILYALGTGAATNPLDDQQLSYVYENHANFQVLPTFGVIPPSASMSGILEVPGLEFNPMMLLHGEQYIEIRKKIPTSGTLTSTARVANIYDKGKAALVELETLTKDENGEDVFFNRSSLFIRGIGGFGGSKGPRPQDNTPPQRAPDVVHREQTRSNQALLYRLCGDRNPLHIDPSMASMGGFKAPILHGLCSMGFATRAIVHHFCNEDASLVKSIQVRFSGHVFPGETIITNMWQVASNKILFNCRVGERGTQVISNGRVVLKGGNAPAAAATTTAAAPAKAAPSSGKEPKAAAVFAQMAKKLKDDPSLVSKMRCSYLFNIDKHSWHVDVKNAPGKVTKVDAGSAPKADCSISMSEANFMGLMQGKLNPQSAFMEGKLKVKGNIMLAQKLSNLITPSSKM